MKHNDYIRQLESRVRMLEDILDHVYECIYATDKDGVIIYFNRATEKLDVNGKKIAIGLTEEAVWGDNILTHAQLLKEGIPKLEIEDSHTAVNGKEIRIIASTYPYFENGELKAVYSVGRDITSPDSYIERTYELQRSYDPRNMVRNVQNGTSYTLEDLVFKSQAMGECVEVAKKLASHPSNIMVFGETGTGKELFTQGIHNASTPNEPFVAVNCAAIPENLLESLLFGSVKGAFTGATSAQGLFEEAGKGTLFLDEVNSLPVSMQAKLLRALQEKKVRRIGSNKDYAIQCRIISATNQSPLELIEDKQLRRDLYYRLSAFVLSIPPVRERKEDILVLVDHFIKEYNRLFHTNVLGLDGKVVSAFLAYDWPGNIREIKHALESAFNIIDKHETLLTLKQFPALLKEHSCNELK
ncbi:MAG: sigma 54-interacting transcriptional regulator [Clostridia bacterium]|nr:sigma 54-interacting transcriptional regulator [Clostridia bacterium]